MSSIPGKKNKESREILKISNRRNLFVIAPKIKWVIGFDGLRDYRQKDVRGVFHVVIDGLCCFY